VVPGVPRYHTDNCILIRFKDVQRTALTAAANAGCTPAAPASTATHLRGTSFYQFRGDKSDKSTSKVVTTDRKMIQSNADPDRPHGRQLLVTLRLHISFGPFETVKRLEKGPKVM
jgi:hypothetical protein